MTDEAIQEPVVRLRHVFHEVDTVLHFYDGEVKVQEGVAIFPIDRPEWAQRSYIKGYRLNPDTREELSWDEFYVMFHGAESATEESAESAGDTNDAVVSDGASNKEAVPERDAGSSAEALPREPGEVPDSIAE